MKSGFQLPENYWGDFKNRLHQRMEKEEKAAEDNSLEVASGYQVPTDYFDDFQVNVDENKSRHIKKIALAIAAMFIIALSIGIAIHPFASNTSEAIDFSDVEEEQIDQYINDDDIDQEILEAYSEQEPANFELNKALQEVDKEEIFSYFNDQLNDLYAYEE